MGFLLYIQPYVCVTWAIEAGYTTSAGPMAHPATSPVLQYNREEISVCGVIYDIIFSLSLSRVTAVLVHVHT